MFLSSFHKIKLEEVLKSVLENKHSSFYADRFLDRAIRQPLTFKSWGNIPFATRAEITATPFWERVFVPRAEVPVIRHTYGTSGKRILITPRSSYGDYQEPYINTGMSRLMCFFASGHNECPRESIDIQVWFGDVGNLEMSAKIAAEGRVDSLSITPYTALNFAKELEKYDAVKNIKTVMLIGERCSPLQLKRINSLYPDADVYGVFASSETREVVALPCVHTRKSAPLVLEQVKEMYCEIIDPNTGSVINEYDVVGELVITTLTLGIPFPLIRYRTGDIAKYTKRSCLCEEGGRGFEVLGRSTVFPVRMAKGELTIDAVEKALNEIPDINPRYFEAHYFEIDNKDKRVLPCIRMVLVTGSEDESKNKELAQQIELKLFVFPTYTYAQGVEDGIYLPIEVSCIRSVPESSPGKQRPSVVVRHISGSQSNEGYYTSVSETRSL
ncbi:hypothetical protein HQ403_01955 [Candidatus Kaiserbacteria bacterium]|nr:hypothetical protein [Candidatus Kaiserbacteria bacterium]